MPAETMVRSRLEQILGHVARYHRANPAVWRLFVRFGLRAAERGAGEELRTYGARMIWERIRWEVNIELRGVDGTRLKLNDHYVAYYARAFMIRYPAHAGLFNLRKLTSAQRPPRRGETVNPDLDQLEMLFSEGETFANSFLRCVFSTTGGGSDGGA